MNILQLCTFLLRFLRKHLRLLALSTLFLFQYAIIASFNNLPDEVLGRIFGHAHSYYHQYLSIASELNSGLPDKSPYQVLSLLKIRMPDICLSCTAFYQAIPKYKATPPDGYTQYLSYLTSQEELFGKDFDEKKKIFCFSQDTKKVLLKNLASLFFGPSIPPLNPPFYEPFAFALTVQDYDRFQGEDYRYEIYKIEGKKVPRVVPSYFFKNVRLLHERLAILNIPIEISIFMADYFEYMGSYFSEGNPEYDFSTKKLFEEVLKSNIHDQKEFVLFLKKYKKEIKQYWLGGLLFGKCDSGSVPNDMMNEIVNNMMNIIKFFIKYKLWFTRDQLSPKALERTRLALNFSDTFMEYPECLHCQNTQEKMIYTLLACFRCSSFWSSIISSLLSIKNSCSHNLFNNKFADFVEYHHPNTDGVGLLKIISLLQKYPALGFYESVLKQDIDYCDKNSNSFKNCVFLTEYLKHFNNHEECITCIQTNATFLKKIEVRMMSNNSESNFWNKVTRKAFAIKKECEHPLFDEHHIKFLKDRHPHLDEQSLLKIISFLPKIGGVQALCEWYKHLDMLDNSSTVFENLLMLISYYEEKNLGQEIDSFIINNQNEKKWKKLLYVACHESNFVFSRKIDKFDYSCTQWNSRTNQFKRLLKKNLFGLLIIGCVLIGLCVSLKKGVEVTFA